MHKHFIGLAVTAALAVSAAPAFAALLSAPARAGSLSPGSGAIFSGHVLTSFQN